jgi:uncharacterized membrane protein
MLSKTLSDIEARVREIRTEIARHPLSLELAILEEALGKLRGIMTAPPVEAAPPEVPVPEPEQSGRITLQEAAERAIEEARYPLPTREVVAEMPRFGVTVGGNWPMKNVSSILSKRSKRVASMRWNGSVGW